MKILIVDDVGYSRHNLEMTLRRLGHDVIQADSGNAGLSILRNDHTIDAVISDLIMDGIDGVEFFIQTKKLERVDDQGEVSSLPFVLLTSAQPGRPGATKSVLNRLKLATEIGIAKILYKPSNLKVIEETLAELQTDKAVPVEDISPLIAQLKEVTQKLIRDDNTEDAEKLKRILQDHVRQLESVGVAVE